MSMESAAIAMMATKATVTSAIVNPRSRERGFRRVRWRSISGGSMGDPSILVKCGSRGSNARRTDERNTQQTSHAAVLPLVWVPNGDAGADQIYCVTAYCLCLDAAPVDGQCEVPAGPTRTARGR